MFCFRFPKPMMGVLTAAIMAVSAPAAAAQIEAILHSFSRISSGGAIPMSGLIFDSAGNLYGTTSGGGVNGAGTVFKLTPTSSGWQEDVLHSFGGSDGSYLQAGVVMDAAGNLYGTASEGGYQSGCHAYGCGEVFQLVPTSIGPWQLNVLYTFSGTTDGGTPVAGVTLDSAGNVYGTTRDGGTYSCPLSNLGNGCGVVFELSPTYSGAWKETVIHNFTGGWDGANPLSGMTFEGGSLYGMAQFGGTVTTEFLFGTGVIYKLARGSAGGWTTTILHSFTGGTDGALPQSTLITDATGNFYGTTLEGGNPKCGDYEAHGCGVVFELSPTSTGQWKEDVLHAFVGSHEDGAGPFAGVVMDSSGNLYGTTYNGGRGCVGDGCGTVYEMSPQPAGGWEGRTLTTFTGQYEGAWPTGTLVLDSSGNLYGTTRYGGADTYGVVFKITP